MGVLRPWLGFGGGALFGSEFEVFWETNLAQILYK